MPTCRTITSETWDHARAALVFYFSRRHGIEKAEDLAQETLATFWKRDDYEFAREEDFLRVCYAFARMISRTAHRNARLFSAREIEGDMAAPPGVYQGFAGPGLSLLLQEVIQTGEEQLSPTEWETILNAAMGASASDGDSPRENNKLRVRLFRARRKLARLTGWK